MSLWKIAFRSIQFRYLSSVLTAFSMSLGVALIVTVLVIHGVLDNSFKRSAQGYDYIIAGKGSPIDVVLSTVFYLRPPVGGVTDTYLQKFQRGEYRHLVDEAIPLTIGHHFRGATLVGTTSALFDKLRFRGDQRYNCAEGEFFKDTNLYAAVLGSQARKKTGLKIGETFVPENMPNPDGTVVADDNDEPHEPFKIVGIMEPTGTPNDNVIFVNIAGFYDMHQSKPKREGEDTCCPPDNPANQQNKTDNKPVDHKLIDHKNADHKHADHEHIDQKHVEHKHADQKRTKSYSALLLFLARNKIKPEGIAIDPKSPDFNPSAVMEERAYVNIAATELPLLLDNTPDIQAVSPVEEITTLLENVIGNVQMVLLFLAVLVVIVAGIGMMVSIYNSMSERKQEIAIMRALGARRFTVMSIILLESILLSIGGGILGIFLGHALVGCISPWISQYTGIIVHAWDFRLNECFLIPGLVLLASIVGFLPAAVAYKQDVATSLAP
ncbi:MAG: ABC transporter permease [Planctomycetaceae bacterium]|jgi:putative ABC transport system permease protein|nr:ABC transporter permease [Planctomycetaceae bacterium]